MPDSGAMARDRTFDSAVDPWLAVLLAVVAALAPLFLVAALAAEDAASAAALAGSALLIAAIMGGLVWPVRYTCAPDALIVRSGLVRYRVPYGQIRTVAASRALWSSPALSLDRLRIDYGTRWLLISPRGRREFLTELRRRAPHLQPTPGGGLAGSPTTCG
jgi:hypothetical protein